MVRRRYLKKGVNLPLSFWNLPEYKGDYRNEIRLAVKLYATYREEAIINVINRETWCYSLLCKKLPNLIEIEQRKLDLVAKQEEILNKIVTKVEPTGSLFRKKVKKDFKDG